MKKKLVVLSGAGISAESGIKTFRDSNGLWENHRIEEVANFDSFMKNPELVLNFYNLRRRHLNEVEPNEAHLILAELEDFFEVHIITQNVDDLHERAGSKNVIHLHGELKKARPRNSDSKIIPWEKDLNVGDLNFEGVQLRPHIVWFGEKVLEMDNAISIAETADILVIVGTSMQVYPAASLIHFVPKECQIFVIDPQRPESVGNQVIYFPLNATEGMKKLKDILINES